MVETTEYLFPHASSTRYGKRSQIQRGSSTRASSGLRCNVRDFVEHASNSMNIITFISSFNHAYRLNLLMCFKIASALSGCWQAAASGGGCSCWISKMEAFNVAGDSACDTSSFLINQDAYSVAIINDTY